MRWETAASVPTGGRAQRLVEELSIDPALIFDARKATHDRDIRPGSMSLGVTALESSLAQIDSRLELMDQKMEEIRDSLEGVAPTAGRNAARDCAQRAVGRFAAHVSERIRQRSP
jgi:hypothetical protein